MHTTTRGQHFPAFSTSTHFINIVQLREVEDQNSATSWMALFPICKPCILSGTLHEGTSLNAPGMQPSAVSDTNHFMQGSTVL